MPSQGRISPGHTCTQTHTGVQWRNEIVMERGIRFMAVSEVRCCHKDGQRTERVRQKHLVIIIFFPGACSMVV